MNDSGFASAIAMIALAVSCVNNLILIAIIVAIQ